MKLCDKLNAIAEWLSNAENEILVSADGNDTNLQIVAETLLNAAEILKLGAEQVEEETLITEDSLAEMAAVAQSFDESGDELLQKQASVIDEILLTIGSPKNYIWNWKQAEQEKIDTLKKKYKQPEEELKQLNSTGKQLEDLKKSKNYQVRRPLEEPLQTRSCPDHAGAQMMRVDEGVFQCSLDHRIYNYHDTGYTKLNGDKVPPGSVSNQTKLNTDNIHTIFDTRETRLNK